MITDKQKQEFIAGYLTAALWSSTDTIEDEDGEAEGVPLDRYEWADGEAEKLHADCHDFMQEYSKLLERYVRRVQASGAYTEWELAGHDFWLTRCGHGVGYWDRGAGVVGDMLAKRCGFGTPYQNIDLTLGDGDELVYANVFPTAYIVQTRNMHTAGHEWRVYSSLTEALQAYACFAQGNAVDAPEYKGWESINFRSPPAYWFQEPGHVLHNVRVMNLGHIPDVY